MKPCTSCDREYERVGQYIRAIQLNARGLCDACTCAEEEANACPECGGVLDTQANIVVDEPYLAPFLIRDAPLPRRLRTAARVVFCTECEYAKEL